MERILVLQLKRIGDLILTFPALAALRAARPEARITLVVADAGGQLSPILPGADRAFVYRRSGTNGILWRHLLFSKYDTVLDFTGTDRSTIMAILSKARRKVTYAKLAEKKRWRGRVFKHLSGASVRDLHTVDYHLALLSEIGIPVPPLSPEITVPTAIREAVENRLAAIGPFALIHPGTARAEKYWPAERWAEIATHLREQHHFPVVMTGSADVSEQAELEKLRTLSPDLVDLSGALSLVEVAEVIRRARIAIGVDSAAMHLANAFLTPQIVLFGPTNPFHWRPRHTHARVLLGSHPDPVTDFQPRHEAEPMSALSTPPVIRAIDSLL